MKEYELLAQQNQVRAYEVLKSTRLVELWSENGCIVNLVGSLPMRLLVKHLDIDMHVYSSRVTEESSFAIVAQIAKNPSVREISCINGLHTDEHCVAWHIKYEHGESVWQIDIIHIESGTEYDGFFERMVSKINESLTPLQRDTILRLKYETPEDEEIHGVEYYQAVMEHGVRTLEELREWVKMHRKSGGTYWMPK